MKSIINWRIFFILLSLSLLSVLAVLPYVITLQGDTIKQLNIPISTIITAQTFQCLILFSITIFLGLFLTKKNNFKLPLLEAIANHKDYKKILQSITGRSVLFGVGATLAIYETDRLFGKFGALISTSQNPAPIWQKLLAAIYGGTTEEILMRLFLMSLFVWISTKIIKTKQNQPTQIGIIVSIVLASIIFGLGHLPITASLTAITPIIVTRAVILNGIGGVAFGWLFWKKGLESAMIAHFTADIFLLTVLPLVLS